MKPSSAKAKGRRCAQEVKEKMMTLDIMMEDDDIMVTPSGVTGEDLKLSPHARAVFPIAAECKNVEKLNIWEALEQAENNAGQYVPVLFFRKNRTKLYAAVDADVLLNLFRHYQGPKNELQSKSKTDTE